MTREAVAMEWLRLLRLKQKGAATRQDLADFHAVDVWLEGTQDLPHGNPAYSRLRT